MQLAALPKDRYRELGKFDICYLMPSRYSIRGHALTQQAASGYDPPGTPGPRTRKRPSPLSASFFPNLLGEGGEPFPRPHTNLLSENIFRQIQLVNRKPVLQYPMGI